MPRMPKAMDVADISAERRLGRNAPSVATGEAVTRPSAPRGKSSPVPHRRVRHGRYRAHGSPLTSHDGKRGERLAQVQAALALARHLVDPRTPLGSFRTPTPTAPQPTVALEPIAVPGVRCAERPTVISFSDHSSFQFLRRGAR